MADRDFKVPVNRTMKHDQDVWELAITVAKAKGVSPRAAIEGTFRCFAAQWMGESATQLKPVVAPVPSAPPAPFDATQSLSSLFEQPAS